MEVSESFNIPVNEYQTPINKELLDSLPDEVGEQLLDFIDNVEFIKRLISPDRKRAKDLPRDEEGRIIVDITNPHILEDMDYFRPSAIHYQKHGCYTFLKPNPNPNSEYKKWFDEERRRCREGYVRGSDGEWVTGYMYWYMNYCPIMLNKTVKGSKKAIRVQDFPETWEGIYLRFHYLEQARAKGHHAIELARRGCSKSFSLASMMAKNLVLGESTEMSKRVTTILTAYQKEYLADKDGTLSKFEPMINFIADNTEFPRLRLRSSSQEMFWQMGYIDSNGRKKGSLNTVMGVSSKDDEGKLRGKRGHIYFEEMGCFSAGTKVLMFPQGIKNIEDIRDGDLVMGKDGTARIVSNYHSGTDNMYKITLSNGDYHVVNSKHLIHYKKLRWDKNEYEYYNKPVDEFIKIPNTDKGYYIEKAAISYNNQDLPIDPYLLGLWLGDGSSAEPAIANEDNEVIEWLSDNYDVTIHNLKQSDTCKLVYLKGVRSIFNKLGLLNNKHIPKDYLYSTTETYKQILAGLIDTDGNLSIKKHSQCFEITQRYDRLHILEDAKFMATNLGLRCTLTKRIASGKKLGVVHYRLKISGNIDIIPTKIKRKQAKPKEYHYKERRNWLDYTFKIEPIGKDTFYGFEVDKDNLFILADNTIVHNSFKNLLTIYDTVRYGLEEGNYTFGLAYLVGTSAEDASDFESAKTLLYSPEGYNIYGVPNVYDRPKQGKPTFGYFFPAFLNRLGCYNKDGVSDVVKALIEVLNNRYKAKYSTDPNSVLRVIAEMPITPAEAIIKVKQAYFPTVALTERLSQLDLDAHAYDDVYVGDLVQDTKSNEVRFVATDDTPIRKFGVDNSTKGALEIFNMPERKPDGGIYNDRYIIGLDPVNNDQAESSSLMSAFVLDLFTDKIVAEYTGRPQFADDGYELVRLLCIYYNARCLYESNIKGPYAYFSKMNCSHLLADTPEYLRDKQIIKYSSFGSNAKGVTATSAVNNYANGLIKDWLLKPVTTVVEENKELKSITVPNLYFIRNRALLEELIAFTPEINVDRCVLQNTQISTANGIKYIQDVNVGDLVLTAGGDYQRVYSTQSNKFSGIKYTLRALGDYRKLECTDNHPILTCHSQGAKGKYWMKSKFKLSTPKYKRADQLSKDDLVLVPTRKNLNKTDIPEDLLYLIGWYIADGSINGNQVAFFLQEDQYEIGVVLRDIINKYYKRELTYHPEHIDKNGRKVSEYIAQEKAEAHLNHSKDTWNGKVKKMWKVNINSRELVELLTRYGGTPNNKTISEELYNCYNVIPLLRGYFEGDGHYRCDVRCDGVERATLEVNSIYEELALKVRQLLLDNNMWCTIRKVKARNERCKPQYNISLTNDNVIPIIEGSLKFKQKLPTHSKITKENFIRNKAGYWVKLREISREYVDTITYNISVENNPSYVANGITTHNCRALGMVMLYREEKMILYNGDISANRLNRNSSNYLGNDDYFTRNYDNR